MSKFVQNLKEHFDRKYLCKYEFDTLSDKLQIKKTTSLKNKISKNKTFINVSLIIIASIVFITFCYFVQESGVKDQGVDKETIISEKIQRFSDSYINEAIYSKKLIDDGYLYIYFALDRESDNPILLLDSSINVDEYKVEIVVNGSSYELTNTSRHMYCIYLDENINVNLEISLLKNYSEIYKDVVNFKINDYLSILK